VDRCGGKVLKKSDKRKVVRILIPFRVTIDFLNGIVMVDL